MFDHKHYVPILKGKQGELNAIEETATELRDRLTPLIEVPPISWKYIENEREPVPAKSIDAHVADVAERLAEAVGSKSQIFVDGFYVDNEATLKHALV